MIFVDTNYFLRFLIGDSKQFQEAKNLFEKGALGEKKLFTSLIVFFEVYWVLSSFYEKKKFEIVRILTGILQMNFIKLKERKTLSEAVNIFKTKTLDLEDSYNLCYAKENKASDFATFDQKLKTLFKKLP